MTAILTRTDDSFPCPRNNRSCGQKISLNERLDIAKKAGAVLFISIHANSFRDRRIRGAEIMHCRILPSSIKMKIGKYAPQQAVKI
jgi:N-acetylmuramoyl-L-alanine amidase